MKLIATSVLILVVTAVICKAAFVENADKGNGILQSPHIIGGKSSTYRYRPQIFHLKFYKNHELLRACTGSSVTVPKYIFLWLTAAECLDNIDFDEMIIEHMYQGTYKRQSITCEQMSYKIHPDYDRNTKQNNIAIIQLTEYLFTDFTSMRIQAPETNDNSINSTVYLYQNWKNVTKATDEGESFELHSIVTNTINPAWCSLWYPFSPSKKNHICVSGWYGKGLQQKDIGMPLVSIEEDGSFKLLGLATTIRPWTHWFGLPIEFLSIKPYMNWMQNFA